MDEMMPNKMRACLPREIVVKYENTLRENKDFWLFRKITNVLRQNAEQIEKYRKRYENR